MPKPESSKRICTPKIVPSAVSAIAACLLLLPGSLRSQDHGSSDAERETPTSTEQFCEGPGDLPNAPRPRDLAEGSRKQVVRNEVLEPAGRYDKYINPGQPVSRLAAADKVVIELRDSVRPYSLLAWLFAAGYSHGISSSPNYGTNSAAFAQRLGAAAARGSSENIFTDSVLSPLLHQDPRFYRMGEQQPLRKRLAYAASRVLVSRTDGGRHVPNLAKLGGELAGSALAQTYYPSVNRGVGPTFKTFGGSAGSASLGYIISEFLPDPLIFFDHDHQP